MTIKDIFSEIASDSSTNKKMEILFKYNDNELLKRVLYLANSRRIKFYIKQIPPYKKLNSNLTLSNALDLLSKLSSRELTGYDAINHLENILSSCSEDDSYIIERIIEKDCKIGMGSTNINKIIPGLIEETPYMGAKSFSEKIAKNILKSGIAFSQIKMDGRYANAIIRFGEVELESRQGETTSFEGALFLNDLRRFPNCVLNGEFTMDPVNGKEIKRYEANGIISSLLSILNKKKEGEDISKEKNKFIKENLMSMEDALASIRYTVWDTITIEEYFAQCSMVPYNERLGNLEKYILAAKPSKVSIIESITVNTYEEAMDHFKSALSRGEEGTILKSYKYPWKDGKPIDACKMKLAITFDLRITGFRYGTGKNSELISTIEAESDDGLLKTAPTGISEKDMKYITENQEKLYGSIIECKSSGISRDHLGNYSMLHPVFLAIRDDKNTCDTLKSIIEIEEMAKGLK